MYPERLHALGMTMVYSRSLQTLTTLSLARSPAYATRFHLATGEFADLSGLPPTQASLNAIDGLAGAVDPTTNHVYIPGTYAGGTLMLDYDIVSKTATTQPMPVVANNSSWSGYTFVWNEARESFFLWGGRGSTGSSYFFEFKPRSANTWTKLDTRTIQQENDKLQGQYRWFTTFTQKCGHCPMCLMTTSLQQRKQNQQRQDQEAQGLG
ncbi:hypothetical protein KI688_005735 [Linnemannia hyalina]|uniref:Uncharacterized protein n=1 Tax=Linnemannia hyalina TaxID=64524 RepID=A0A9P7Y3E1_9FUNG|nr:hypothetical protein KI688_005735 [Linnemannia hyalina]